MEGRSNMADRGDHNLNQLIWDSTVSSWRTGYTPTLPRARGLIVASSSTEGRARGKYSRHTHNIYCVGGRPWSGSACGSAWRDNSAPPSHRAAVATVRNVRRPRTAQQSRLIHCSRRNNDGRRHCCRTDASSSSGARRSQSINENFR